MFKKYILVIELLFTSGYLATSQMAVHGDVFIASEGTLAFHGEELHFFQGHIHTDELLIATSTAKYAFMNLIINAFPLPCALSR